MTQKEFGEAQRLALEFREQLLRDEAEAARQILRFYRSAKDRIRRDLEKLLKRIAKARAAGVEITPNWLNQESRFRSLIRQVNEEIQTFSEKSAAVSERSRAIAITNAVRNAEAILGVFELSFDALPSRQLTQLASRIAAGTPLRALFESLGPEISQKIAETLFSSTAEGQGLRKTGRQIARIIVGPDGKLDEVLHRAQLIARTEVLGAFREASLSRYATGGVARYMRIAALSSRTCPACLALHLKVFPVSVPFVSHPACRCTAIPVVGGLPRFQSGETWLRKQKKETQIQVLGKTGRDLWNDRQIRLDDFVQETYSPTWGPGIRQRSLSEMRRLGLIA